MASCVHYKFKSCARYNTIKFDGLYISCADLKRLIIRKSGFDVDLKNAQTEAAYEKDDKIPRNSAVVVIRVPVKKSQKRKAPEEFEQERSALKEEFKKYKEQHKVECVSQAPEITVTKADKGAQLEAGLEELKKILPEPLICPVCLDLMKDAVIVRCCGNSACDECVRNGRMASENDCCPICKVPGLQLDQIVDNKFLRRHIKNFDKDYKYYSQVTELKDKPKVQRVPTPPPEPQPARPTLPNDMIGMPPQVIQAYLRNASKPERKSSAQQTPPPADSTSPRAYDWRHSYELSSPPAVTTVDPMEPEMRVARFVAEWTQNRAAGSNMPFLANFPPLTQSPNMQQGPVPQIPTSMPIMGPNIGSQDMPPSSLMPPPTAWNGAMQGPQPHMAGNHGWASFKGPSSPHPGQADVQLKYQMEAFIMKNRAGGAGTRRSPSPGYGGRHDLRDNRWTPKPYDHHQKSVRNAVRDDVFIDFHDSSRDRKNTYNGASRGRGDYHSNRGRNDYRGRSRDRRESSRKYERADRHARER